MVIKKRPVITWLLNSNISLQKCGVVLPRAENPMAQYALKNSLLDLEKIRNEKPEWGLPELVMPSFEKVMQKSYDAFDKIMPELFHEFSEEDECGILLCKRTETIVYGFGNDTLYIWYFSEVNEYSIFKFHIALDFDKGKLRVGISDAVINDKILTNNNLFWKEDLLGEIAQYVVAYAAIKRYGDIEVIEIPQGIFTDIEGTPLENDEKKKIVNRTGQRVIVMDSRWFRKIVNDNDIPVRGFFRNQNKKDKDGIWIKERIWINPFVRHGYHRNAGIENS